MGGVAATVTVRFFASLREAVQRERIELALPTASIAGVRARLADLLSADQLEAVNAQGVQVAVNQAIVQHNATLAEGDEVAFLPPVTGG